MMVWLRDNLSRDARMSRRLVALSLPALLAACFDTPDYEGRLCESGNLCPAGFTCGEDGRCHKGTQSIDDAGDPAAGDAAYSDGNTRDANDVDVDAGPDADAGAPSDSG